MGEPVAKVVGVAAGEDLRFGFEAAEGAGMDDAIAVALKVVAVGMRGLRKKASAGALDVHRVGGQHVRSLAERNGAHPRASPQRLKPIPRAPPGGTTEVVPFPFRLQIAVHEWRLQIAVLDSAFACRILPGPALPSRRRVFAGPWRKHRCRPQSGPSCSPPERRDPSERQRVSGGRSSDRDPRDAPAPWDRSPCGLLPWSGFLPPDRTCPA